MRDEQEPTETMTVRCAVCEKEIPTKIACSNADPEYPLYFCSTNCYEEWSDDQLALKVQDAGEP